jgi:hypothetical protein
MAALIALPPAHRAVLCCAMLCCRAGARTTAGSATPLGQTASRTSCRGMTWIWSAEHTRCDPAHGTARPKHAEQGMLCKHMRSCSGLFNICNVVESHRSVSASLESWLGYAYAAPPARYGLVSPGRTPYLLSSVARLDRPHLMKALARPGRSKLCHNSWNCCAQPSAAASQQCCQRCWSSIFSP